MSDIEAESDNEIFEDESSSDEEIVEIKDIPSEEYTIPTSNKFMNILMKNMKYPSKFIVHSLIMARVKALFCNAKPLSSNPPPMGSDDYNTIFLKIVKIAVDEVMENRSPMMFYNPITQTEWSANDLDKTLFKKIMDEAIELSSD